MSPWYKENFRLWPNFRTLSFGKKIYLGQLWTSKKAEFTVEYNKYKLQNCCENKKISLTWVRVLRSLVQTPRGGWFSGSPGTPQVPDMGTHCQLTATWIISWLPRGPLSADCHLDTLSADCHVDTLSVDCHVDMLSAECHVTW